jgi:hypothetical protein
MVTATNDPTAHGEMTAVRAACMAPGTFSLAGCELYTRCEPCRMCLAAAHWARLDAVYFGAVHKMRQSSASTMNIFTRSSARILSSDHCLRCGSFVMRLGPALRRGLLYRTRLNIDLVLVGRSKTGLSKHFVFRRLRISPGKNLHRCSSS